MITAAGTYVDVGIEERASRRSWGGDISEGKIFIILNQNNWCEDSRRRMGMEKRQGEKGK